MAKGNTINPIVEAAVLAIYKEAMSLDVKLEPDVKSEIMWQFIRKWDHREHSPYLKLWDMEGMLLPFSAEDYEKTIPQWAWDNVRKEAVSILMYASESSVELSPAVKEHLISITEGNIPFGFSIEKEEEDGSESVRGD